MTNRQKAILAVVLSSFLGGAIGSFGKIALKEMPPLTFSFLRFLFAAFFLAIFFRLKIIRILNQLKPLILVSLLATANIIFYILGLTLTTATISQLLYAAVPLLTGIFLCIFYKKLLKGRQIFGLIIGLMGVIIIVLLPLFQKEQKFSGNLIGNLLIIFGILCYSWYVIFSQKMQKTYTPLALTIAFILTTTLILFPFFILDLKQNYGWWNYFSLKGIISLLYSSIMATALTYLLNQYAIKHGGALVSTMTLYLSPVFAFLAASYLLGEQLTSGIVLGGIMAILGIYFVTRK